MPIPKGYQMLYKYKIQNSILFTSPYYSIGTRTFINLFLYKAHKIDFIKYEIINSQ